MRQMYFLVFIFSFYCGNAQLQFSLPSIEDSCIYLSDCFLYIEKDFNLAKNNPPKTEASIYNKKESELLQAEKITNLDSENRLISVFQEGTFNAFDYNNWEYTGIKPDIAPGLQGFLMEKPRKNSHILKDYRGGFASYTGGNSFERAREDNPIAQEFIPTGKNRGYINFKKSKRRFQKEKTQTFEFKNQQKSEIPQLKLNVIFNGLYTRPLLLSFREDSSKDEDWPMDAKIYGVLDNDIGWNINDAFYNIQVRPFRKNDMVPLLIKLTEPKKLTFCLDDSRYFENDDIFLFDAELDTYKQLDENNFSIDLQKGNYSKRFFLSFMKENNDKSYSEVMVEEIESKDFLNPKALIFQNNIKSQLEIQVIQTDIKQILLYDLNGQMIYNKTMPAGSLNYTLPTSGLQDALYIVKLISSDNLEFTNKVSINN